MNTNPSVTPLKNMGHKGWFSKGETILTQDKCDPEKPEEFAAWVFAAGVPDPRNDTIQGGRFPDQPLIPPACFGAVSKRLWKLGFRHHPELQEEWVKPANNRQFRNFTVWDVVDKMPEAAEFIVEEFPDIAKTLAKVTPENHREMVQAQGEKVMSLLEQLQKAQEGMTAPTIKAQKAE